MKIIEIAPYTNPRIISVESKILPSLYTELNLSLTPISLGSGFVLLTNTHADRDVDEFNFYISSEGEYLAILGKSFIIKAGLHKIIEITEEDFNYIKTLINP